MNNPLDHRGFTFYQSNYIRMRDPHTGSFTGQFQSIFQVATNPGRPIIYGGCVLVVAGRFHSVLHAGGDFHRRRQERTRQRPRRKSKPSHSRQPANEDL